MTKLSKKKIFIAFVICVFIFVGWSVVYKKNDDKLGEELDYIMSQIDDLEEQYNTHCATQEAKNTPKCQEIYNKRVAKSDEWGKKGFGGIDYESIVNDLANLEKQIKTKCDNEYFGQADNQNCEQLKHDFYLKLKDICQNDKINSRVCSYFVSFAGFSRATKMSENLKAFDILACQYGDLNSCYIKALYTDNLQEAKKILQENCQKSHQQSCDKLKELK